MLLLPSMQCRVSGNGWGRIWRVFANSLGIALSLIQKPSFQVLSSSDIIEEQAVSVQWRVLTRASCIVRLPVFPHQWTPSGHWWNFSLFAEFSYLTLTTSTLSSLIWQSWRKRMVIIDNLSGKRASEAIVGTTGIGLAKVIAERSVKQPIFDSCQNCTHVNFAWGFRTYTV